MKVTKISDSFFAVKEIKNAPKYAKKITSTLTKKSTYTPEFRKNLVNDIKVKVSNYLSNQIKFIKKELFSI